VATLSPPNKRLRRFAKVTLTPGQSRTLNFKLRSDDLSYIGANNKPVVEPGDFEVTVGGLTQRFNLKLSQSKYCTYSLKLDTRKPDRTFNLRKIETDDY